MLFRLIDIMQSMKAKKESHTELFIYHFLPKYITKITPLSLLPQQVVTNSVILSNVMGPPTKSILFKCKLEDYVVMLPINGNGCKEFIYTGKSLPTYTLIPFTV